MGTGSVRGVRRTFMGSPDRPPSVAGNLMIGALGLSIPLAAQPVPNGITSGRARRRWTAHAVRPGGAARLSNDRTGTVDPCARAQDSVRRSASMHGASPSRRWRTRRGGGNNGAVRLEDRDPASLTIADFFAYLLADDDAATAREGFCDVVASQTKEVASWLGFDAWLGAGDVEDPSSPKQHDPDPARSRSFVAVGLVAQISGELVSGAQLLLRSGNVYGASALVRQLIECEYLLRAFRLNFAEAARWHDANDVERWDFKPSKLRVIGGFDRKEYADHCESGGHPHPRGSRLLPLPRTIDDLQRAVAGDSRGIDTTRALWLDFAFHCDRTWRALIDLLSAEHARFDRVRADRISAVAESRSAWQEADILARHAGPILEALYADPATLLSDLLDLDQELDGQPEDERQPNPPPPV